MMRRPSKSCRALGVLLMLLVAAPAAARAMSLPMYGNWCGPGHPRDAHAARLAPIDGLDAACMAHDLCTAQVGRQHCGCDIRFMNRVRDLRYPTADRQAIARAMYDALAMIPCDDPMDTAYKQARVWSDLAADFFSGRAGPWEMPLRWMALGDRAMWNKSWRDRWGW